MPYFFDSYALIEIFLKSPNFAKYIEEEISITILNLIEVAQYFLTHFGEEKAEKVCNELSENVVEISNMDIVKAVKFRAENKRKSFSYADCIGYIYAKSHGMIFLTGDIAFKGMPNVEFVQ